MMRKKTHPRWHVILLFSLPLFLLACKGGGAIVDDGKGRPVQEPLPTPKKEEPPAVDMSKVGYAPPFSATDMAGDTLSIEGLKGKIVVMNFWFTRCAPCLDEIPQLNGLVERYKGRDVEFIAVTYDPHDRVAAFLEKTPFHYRHIADAEGILRAYFVSGFPTNIVIDQNGKVAYEALGYMTRVDAAIAAQLDKLLE